MSDLHEFPESSTPLSAVAGFVGRDREMAELSRQLTALAAGSGGLMLLTGEPGIGKTRLAEELADRAESHQVEVLWGRCRQAEGRPSYWPWTQILDAGGGEQEGNGVGRAKTQAGPEAILAQLMPEQAAGSVASDVSSSDSETARFQLFQALTSRLRAMAKGRPLLLILDDLHWADLPSLRFLDFLSHELADSQISIVGTYRDVEVRLSPPVAELMASLIRRAQHLPLPGLNLGEVGRFIEAAAGHSVPETLASRLFEQTNGNPFFLDAMMRLLRTGDENLDAFAAGALSVPLGVRGVIRQRLDLLPEATLTFLAAASVAGREFDLRVVESLLDDESADGLGALTPALEIDVVVALPSRPGRYRFSHALVRDTVYEELPTRERAEWHRRFAHRLIERSSTVPDERLAELAHHLYEAVVLDGPASALVWVERAGRHALGVLAYEEAADHFERALHLLEMEFEGDSERTCELLLSLGDARNRCGEFDESARVYHRAATIARRLDSPKLLARAATGLCNAGATWTQFGRADPELVGVLEEALDALDENDFEHRARVMARLSSEMVWSATPEASEEMSLRAVETARRAKNPSTLAYTLLARVHCRQSPDAFEERAVLLREMLDETGGRGELGMNTWLWMLSDALQGGDVAETDRCRRNLARAVTDLRQPADLWIVATVEAQVAMFDGRFDDVEASALAMLDGPPPPMNVAHTAFALLFLVYRDRGTHGALVDGIAEFNQERAESVTWSAVLALVQAETGSPDPARVTLDRLVTDGFEGIDRDLTWVFTLALLTEVCVRCGTEDQAQRLFDALEPYEGRNVLPGPFFYFGPVTYYRGLLASQLGRHAEAVAFMELARQSAASFGAEPWLARIATVHARVLLEAGGDSRMADAGASSTNRGAGSGAASAPDQGSVEAFVDAAEGDNVLTKVAELCRQARSSAERFGMAGLLKDIETVETEVENLRSSAEAATDPANGSEPNGSRVSAAGPRRVGLRREGDVWAIVWEGRTSLLKSMRGLEYLGRLLAEPRREFHVTDLAAGNQGPAPSRSGADLGPALDSRARREIEDRLADLTAEREEAEQFNDLERRDRAQAEIDRLGEEVARAVGLGGRDRPSKSDAERARGAVTKALRSAINRISEHEPPMGDLLSRTIRTGAYCSYEPPIGLDLEWEL